MKSHNTSRSPNTTSIQTNNHHSSFSMPNANSVHNMVNSSGSMNSYVNHMNHTSTSMIYTNHPNCANTNSPTNYLTGTAVNTYQDSDPSSVSSILSQQYTAVADQSNSASYFNRGQYSSLNPYDNYNNGGINATAHVVDAGKNSSMECTMSSSSSASSSSSSSSSPLNNTKLNLEQLSGELFGSDFFANNGVVSQQQQQQQNVSTLGKTSKSVKVCDETKVSNSNFSAQLSCDDDFQSLQQSTPISATFSSPANYYYNSTYNSSYWPPSSQSSNTLNYSNLHYPLSGVNGANTSNTSTATTAPCNYSSTSTIYCYGGNSFYFDEFPMSLIHVFCI